MSNAKTEAGDGAKAVGALFAGITAVVVSGWAFMLAVGVVRADWLHFVPTIGFGPAVALVALARETAYGILPRAEAAK